MKITNVKVYPTMQGTLRAYADITLDSCLSIRELRLLRRDGRFVLCMPNVKQTDGTFREVAYPANDRTLKTIQDAVIAEYEKIAGPKTRSRHRTWPTYLTRPCPRCNGYLGIVLREPGRNMPVRAVNGHCLKCGYRPWIVISGKRRASKHSFITSYAEPTKDTSTRSNA